MGHNVILTDLTIIIKGTIITKWGLQGYNNNNKGVTLTTIRDYTSNIGTYMPLSFKKFLSSMLE